MAVKEIRPQPGAQEDFLSTSADIALYGGAAGAGKSWALLIEALRHIDNPEFGAVFFRRTSPMITNEGGLWDAAANLYPLVGGKAYESAPRYYKFPSGATISFTHLQHEKNKQDWQGSEIALIVFDELTHFTESQFWYMLSRNRSTCGVRPYIRATTNPDADSWVAKFIAWWIDEDSGYPIPERSGVVRWFYRIDNALRWYDSAEEAREDNPEMSEAGVDPKSFTFIMGKLADNPALTSKDPGYLGSLMALQLVERMRLHGGNWKIRHTAGNMFRRHWFQLIAKDRAPKDVLARVRYWDQASTEEKVGKKGEKSRGEKREGDYTAGVRMAVTKDGRFIIEHVVRGRWTPGSRDKTILDTARMDPPGTIILIEQEGGSAGVSVIRAAFTALAEFTVRKSKPTTNKVLRADPYSSQTEAGNVYLVEGEWNEQFIDEHERFPEGDNDDTVDAAAGAYASLAKVLARERR